MALSNGSKSYVQPIESALSRFYSKSKSSKHQREYLSGSDSDSDSDNEGKRLRVSSKMNWTHSDGDDNNNNKHVYFSRQGESEFWRRKMRTLHSLLDINNDGVISYDDFKMLAKNFADLGHLSGEAKAEFEATLQQIWEAQWGEITPYNLVNAEQYLTEMQHAVNDKDLREKIHTFLPFLFKVCTTFMIIIHYLVYFVVD